MCKVDQQSASPIENQVKLQLQPMMDSLRDKTPKCIELQDKL